MVWIAIILLACTVVFALGMTAGLLREIARLDADIDHIVRDMDWFKNLEQTRRTK